LSVSASRFRSIRFEKWREPRTCELPRGASGTTSTQRAGESSGVSCSVREVFVRVRHLSFASVGLRSWSGVILTERNSALRCQTLCFAAPSGLLALQTPVCSLRCKTQCAADFAAQCRTGNSQAAEKKKKMTMALLLFESLLLNTIERSPLLEAILLLLPRQIPSLLPEATTSTICFNPEP